MRSLLLATLAILWNWSALAQQQVNPTYGDQSPCPSDRICQQPVDIAHPLPTTGAGGVSSAPYQFTSAGAGQSQLAVATTGVTALTPPSGTLAFTVCLRTGAGTINYSIDGSTPTTGATGNLRQLVAGQCVGYSGAALASTFRAIAATTNTAIDVEYLK